MINWVLAAGATASTFAFVATSGAASPPSSADLARFQAALNRWSRVDARTPRDVAEMLEGSSIVATGELARVRPGRKAFAGRGCDVVADEATGECAGNPRAIIFDSYANIVVKLDDVIEGILPNNSKRQVVIEVPWPNNAPLDSLEESLPFGARVVVIGSAVSRAQAEAEPLEQAGIVPPGMVQDNLFEVPPYGQVVEGTGGVVAPLSEEGAIVTRDSSALRSYDDFVAAVEAESAK